MDRNQIQRIVKDWETQASQKIPVYTEFSMVNDIISSLEEITGKDRIDDPFKNKNDTRCLDIFLCY